MKNHKKTHHGIEKYLGTIFLCIIVFIYCLASITFSIYYLAPVSANHETIYKTITEDPKPIEEGWGSTSSESDSYNGWEFKCGEEDKEKKWNEFKSDEEWYHSDPQIFEFEEPNFYWDDEIEHYYYLGDESNHDWIIEWEIINPSPEYLTITVEGCPNCPWL